MSPDPPRLLQPQVETSTGLQRSLTPSSSLTNGISVVVPVYNSQQSLSPLVERLEPVLTEIAGPDSFEVILVNDGSQDDSWSVVQDLAQRFAWVQGIDLMRTFGQHNAVLCGLRAARFDVTVTMDDDLQHPPEELPALVTALHGGVDVVYGSPEAEQHGMLRNLASTITKLALQQVMGAQTARRISAWRILRTDLRRAFENYRGAFVSIDVLLTWATQRFAIVNLHHEPRTLGQSNYNVFKLIRHALNMITGFSVMPLQLASWTGFVFTLFGMVSLLWAVGRYLLQGQAVPGFAFLASIISVFAGAQLFSLGIIGEYLARMHVRIMDRPTYIARRSETVAKTQPNRPND